jgi:hypothetical protein
VLITKLLALILFITDILFWGRYSMPKVHSQLKGKINDLMGDRSGKTFAKGKITVSAGINRG